MAMNTTLATPITMGMDRLRAELRSYYAPHRYDRLQPQAPFLQRRDRIWAAMDAFAAASPGLPAVLLKARLHEEIAARFEPAIFPHSPFFFEMGVRPAENWGTPAAPCAGAWLRERRHSLCRETPEWQRVVACHSYHEPSPLKLWAIWDVFDSDHHCLGYTRLLERGVNGLLDEIARRRRAAADASQAAFLEAAARGCQALLLCATRFAESAEHALVSETDADARRCLGLLAAAARRVPAEPPRTFHEALAALLFLREATASLEAIGISVLGHLDRLLIDYYRRDRREGRLTDTEAADLLARWMLPHDVKFHLEDNPWPETSTCMELGGCDADGRPVFNELTQLILEVHHAHGLANPKLNCRYGATSPREYLELLAGKVLVGHNHFAFLNDDILIPALVRAGKTLAHARLYVNGGCQEPMVEGYEHSAGAYYYVNMARIFDLFLRPLDAGAMDPVIRDMLGAPPAAANCDTRVDTSGLQPDGSGVAADEAGFVFFYQDFFARLRTVVSQGAAWASVPGRRWHEVHPCPLFSASLYGCLEQARDYTAGGAVYNPSGIALVGFGTVVDALFAVRRAVFEERWCSLAELQAALAANWQGHEKLRARLVQLPKYGHGHAGVDALASRFARDLGAFCSQLCNERGGHFQASLFVYYMFVRLGAHVRATPDGRRDGEWLSQGAAPGRLQPADSLTSTFASLSTIDFRDFPANAVLDVQLPLNGGGTVQNLAAVLRTFAAAGGSTLQLNCVSVEELREAQRHPEQYPTLTVRISGLSARFVALNRDVQDEIIARTLCRA